MTNFQKQGGGRSAIQKLLIGRQLIARHVTSMAKIQGTLCISKPLVLIQNVFRHKPGKIALLGPFVQHIGARVFAPGIWLSETRNARHEHVSVNDAARLLPLSFPRQR